MTGQPWRGESWLDCPARSPPSPQQLLIVEDDPATLQWLSASAGAVPGVSSFGCGSVGEARDWLDAHRPDFVLSLGELRTLLLELDSAHAP